METTKTNTHLVRKPDSIKVLVILGPTASGKTRLAVQLATAFNGEIISADSRQVYRGMDIGTGKDLSEFSNSSHPIPYHLIDITDPETPYDLFHFQQDCFKIIQAIHHKGKLPVLTGGTGMYISAVIQQYQLVPMHRTADQYNTMNQEELVGRLSQKRLLHNKTDTLNRRRTIQALRIADSSATVPSHPSLDPLVIGIQWPRPLLHKRIEDRLHDRFSAGMIEEVQQLLSSGLTTDQLRYFGLEYKWITDFLSGTVSREEMETGLFQAIRKFAKRQETWFRKMEKEGIHIHWTDGRDLHADHLIPLIQTWFYENLPSDQPIPD